MLFWIFLLGVVFSFIIPAVNFYLSEKNGSYIYYILYILFSALFVLFTFLKYDNLVLFPSIELSEIYKYERAFNSVPAIFYYLFLWNYVLKSERSKEYRKVLKWLLIFTFIFSPFLNFIEVFQVHFFNLELVTLILGSLILAFAIYLCISLLRDKKNTFKIIGLGFLIFLILVTSSLFIFSLQTDSTFFRNPHKLFLIGMIVELTMLNYALNLSNLDFREKLTVENNQLGGLALRSQMNPHFIHNSLNAIQYFIQRNEVELSESYLSKFSLLIRLFFEYSRKKTITIKEELELLTNYLEIEKLRFEDKLSYNISVCERIDTEEQLIPSMLLQPIVENAVNHGLFHKKENGTIVVAFQQLDKDTYQVTVNDDGIGINKSKKLFKNSSKNYQSNSSAVLHERLDLLNKSNEWDINYTIKDISEIDTTKTGTLVTLIIKQLHGL